MRHQNRTLAFSIMLAGSVALAACGSGSDSDAMKLAASAASDISSGQGVPVKPSSASGLSTNENVEPHLAVMNDKDRPDVVAPAAQAAANATASANARTTASAVSTPNGTAASAAGTNSTSTTSTQNAAQTGWNGFRHSRAELEDIANANKLARRVFYEAPSEGPDAAWFDAIKRGDTATVKQMLDAGQNIEAKDEAAQGQTALGWAAFIGYEDIVDLLIGKGADLNATDRGDVYNTLKSAVLGKNVRIVKKIHDLLRDSTDLNDQSRESDGETLLMVAASNNRLEIAEYLIAEGADLNLVTTTQDMSVAAHDQSALSYACTRNHTDMQALLIRHGAINHRTGTSGC